MEITDKELSVLKSIPQSDYVNLAYSDRRLIGFETPAFACDREGITGRSLSGVISSLNKKGLVVSSRYPNDGYESVAMTEGGFIVLNNHI